MGTSAITITALTATPTLRGNKLKATVLATGPAANVPKLMTQTVVFMRSITNNYSTATEVDRGNPEALDSGLIEEQTYCYWAYVLNNSGSAGPVFPVSPTGGVPCTAAGRANLIDGIISASVAGNALTVAIKTPDGRDPSALNPAYVNFFAVPSPYTLPKTSTSLTGAKSISVPAGQTFGTVNSVPFRLWVVAVLNAGNFYVGLINCVHNATGPLSISIQPIPEGFSYGNSLILDNGYTPNNNMDGTVYVNAGGAGAQVSQSQVRILGYLTWESGLPTVGQWSALPSVTQLYAPGMAKPGDVINQVVSTSIPTFNASFNDTGGAGAALPLPMDNTIPQQTEAYWILSKTVNVQSSCNVMEVEFATPVAPDAANQYVALMTAPINGAAAAIAVEYSRGADIAMQMVVKERAISGSMAGFSRECRIGYTRTGVTSPSYAKVYTGYIAGNAMFGGIWQRHVSIKELMG
jgi:hypothetical protein